MEHHYWLKDSFLNKLGKMAPNLQELSLRRMNISNQSFEELCIYLKNVHTLDISECPLIEEKGLIKFVSDRCCGDKLIRLEA